MIEYRVAVPMRTRDEKGIKHEGVTFYTVRARTPKEASTTALKEAQDYLRNLYRNKQVVTFFVYEDKTEVYDTRNGRQS
jgi:hypothetical protein